VSSEGRDSPNGSTDGEYWPNNDGIYPWDEKASKAFKEWQPVLGETGE
jgi:hypothetical protein